METLQVLLPVCGVFCVLPMVLVGAGIFLGINIERNGLPTISFERRKPAKQSKAERVGLERRLREASGGNYAVDMKGKE